MPLILRQTGRIDDFYKPVYLRKKIQQARHNPCFFRDCLSLTYQDNLVAKLNKSLLMKLPKEVHIYNSVDSVDIKKNETSYTLQEFLQSQTLAELSLSRFNFKVVAFIIFFCNLYSTLAKCDGTQIIITQLE